MAFCRTVEKYFKGEYHLRRMRIPKGELDSEGRILTDKLTCDEKKFSTLKFCDPHDTDPPHETENLVTLIDPREWTMLHNMRERYEKDTIFTNVGVVLVATFRYCPVVSPSITT